jgi:F420-0:gamma-glutamyl ligase
MRSLRVDAIQTDVFRPGAELLPFVLNALEGSSHGGELEGRVIALTSKLVSLSERAWVPTARTTKQALVERESTAIVAETRYGSPITVTRGMLMPAAGIDESNSPDGHYLTLPLDPFQSARTLWSGLRLALGVKKLGVILTDSHSSPLRRGVTGVALSHFGFAAVHSLVGNPDLYGRELKMSQVNVADALAAAAVLAMGESTECQPIAVLSAQGLHYTDALTYIDTQTESSARDEIQIAPNADLYSELFKK